MNRNYIHSVLIIFYVWVIPSFGNNPLGLSDNSNHFSITYREFALKNTSKLSLKSSMSDNIYSSITELEHSSKHRSHHRLALYTNPTTIITIDRDSSKTQKNRNDQIHYLRQLRAIRKIGPAFNLKTTSTLDNHKTSKSILPQSQVDVEKSYRSFPSLDLNIVENNNFNVSFVNLEPEFTAEYIAANFDRNPKVDEVVSKAKEALKAVKKLGNFVDIITGKELLELPVGLKKTDSTSGNTVELAITQVQFKPEFAEFSAWAKMIVPVKGPNGEPNRELYFGAEGIKMSHDGALLNDMKLVLLGDQPITLNGDSWLLTLKGGINLKTGVFSDQSFVEFDCSGLKAINIEADLRISRNILIPITSGGNYKCGDKNVNKYFRNTEEVKNECYVGASFSVKANGWNDLLVEVELPQFEVRGLKGWGFNIKRAVLDLSDSRNALGIQFPKDYSEVLTRGQRNLWRGFYAKELSIMLPKGLEQKETSNKRVQYGAQHLILDSQGVSGTFFAENVLKVGEGSAGQWGFSIADISISLSRNSLTGGSIGGDIAVPIFEKPMEYSGYIQPASYGLEVGLQSTYKTAVFLGEMKLNRNSTVAIDVKDGHAYPSANLSGELSIIGKINQKENEEALSTSLVENSGKGFNFPGITFEELKLETEPGKKNISAKSFGFEGEMKLMNFPASVEKLELITPSNQVGLSFDLKINLDREGSHATTSMKILGKLEEEMSIQKWKFERIKVDGIEIDYEKSGISLKGGLEIMEDHSWYGDGFRGKVTATIKNIDVQVDGKAIFGNKEFRYWNVDVWTENKGKSNNKFLINSMVGGISYRMKKIRGNENGFSTSSAVYRPNKDYGLNIRAGVGISTQNENTFNGRAFLELTFNKHGGLNRVGFIGEGAFMSSNSTTGSSGLDFGALNKTLEKVNDFIENNKSKIEKLAKKGEFLKLAKESIPIHDVAASGKVGTYLSIEKDFVNNSFDGEFALYMDLEGIKGGGEHNLAGYAKMHTGTEDWYIYIGTPQKRLELLFQAGAQLRVGGYFMTGTQLPSQLDPHPMVVKILGEDMLNGNRQENQLQAGKGFAFGLNFGYGYGFDYLIFYASVELGAGFDVMHGYYPDAKCVGRPGLLGNNGWYSMGQVYAYLYGEFGVQVDLSFIKGKFPIAEAGVAAMLRGQFPNPAYFQGYVGMHYKILGGLVEGRMRLKVEVGEECELENINKTIGVPMISDVTPKNKSDDISVFAAPQAVFNYAADTDFSVELEKNTKIFKLRLRNFTVSCEGKNLKGILEWNDTKDAVTFKPDETLPSEKKINVLVEVSFDEKINGSYHGMTENGRLIVEKKEISFITDRAPDYIPKENIAYMYPVIEQQNFYPEEYPKGYLKMKTPQHYLFDSNYEMRAEFVSPVTNKVSRTNLSYDRSKATVFFEVPKNMSLDSYYLLNLMIFPPGANISSEITVQNTEFLSDETSGDTNWFDPTSGDQDNRQVTGSAVVSNKKAANVISSNGAPKSILAYQFKTSNHSSFKEKVKKLSITENLTNYIFSDVHSLSILVDDYEHLDKLEIIGGKYTNSKALVYAQAVLDDKYYKNTIYPLLYKNYPLDGSIRVNREENILGTPPKRSFYIGNEYLFNLENNPKSPWVKNRIPFVYNLPFQYKTDMIYLRNKILNKYFGSDGNESKYEEFKYLIGNSFPPLPLGSFKTQLIYRTPGAIYQKGYNMKYVND